MQKQKYKRLSSSFNGFSNLLEKATQQTQRDDFPPLQSMLFTSLNDFYVFVLKSKDYMRPFQKESYKSIGQMAVPFLYTQGL